MQSYELEDNISPYLKKLFDISEGLGLQAMNKSGHHVRNLMAAKSKSLGSHKYGQAIVNGRRVLLDSTEGGGKSYYSRISHADGSKQADMGDLVRYKLYKHSRTMLVGWINVKGFNTTFFKGGVPSKGNFVKGTKTKEIARTMAQGGQIPLTDAQVGLFYRSGWGNAARRGFVDRKPHPFMSFSSYLGTANSVAQKEFNIAVEQFKQTA